MGQALPPSRRIGDYHDELQASLDAQRELGPRSSEAVAASFLREIEQAIDEKIEARLAMQERGRRSGKWLLAATVVGSTTAMIPLTAVGIQAGGFGGFLGVFVAWMIVIFLDLVIALRS
jgi:hypothetical protein